MASPLPSRIVFGRVRLVAGLLALTGALSTGRPAVHAASGAVASRSVRLASALAPAAMLGQGGSVAPIPIDPVAPSSGNLLATNVIPNYGFFDPDHRINFVSLRQAVYRDPATGGLDFYFSASDSASSSDNVTSIAFSGFAGYTADVYLYPNMLPVFGGCCSGTPPSEADRDSTGRTVAFQQGPLTINRDSYTMEIRTNATDFALTGTATFDMAITGHGEGSLTLPAYQPMPVIAVACPAGCGAFKSTGAMSVARQGQAAVLLNNGQVLVAGNDSFNTSADLYDPSSGVFTPTGSLNIGRCYGCAATALPDGSVLVAGGWSGGPVLASAELFNPLTGTFTATYGSMTTGRLGPSATLLQTGKVLVAFGHNGSSAIGSADLYDPATQTFSATGPPMAARLPLSAMLQDGRVLFAGGQAPGGSFLASAEVYDPQTGTFSFTGSLSAPRHSGAAMRLLDGRVLVTGGLSDSQTVTSSAEIYDPATGTFSLTGPMTTPRDGHATILLSDGTVLVLGGTDATGHVLASAELFDPATGTFMPTVSMVVARSSPSATILADGRILVAGGNAQGGALLDSAELYECVTTSTPTVTWNPASLTYGTPLGAAQLNATASTLGNFMYDPVPGAILGAGSHTLSLTFQPADAGHFTPVSMSVPLQVGQASPILHVTGGLFIANGAAHPANASATGAFGEALGPVTVTYNGSPTPPTAIGTYAVLASLAGSANYLPASASSSVTIAATADLLVTDVNHHRVIAYDLSTRYFEGEFITTGSGGLSYDNCMTLHGDYLFVCNSDTYEILRYDATTGAVAPSAGHSGAVFAANVANRGPFSGPSQVRFGPDGNLYVTSNLGATVERYDGMTGAPLPSAGQSGATFAVTLQNVGLDFGADGNLYVANFYPSSVWRMDGRTGAFIDEFVPMSPLTGSRNSEIVWGPDGNLYVAGRTDDPFNGGVVRRYDVYGNPMPAPTKDGAVVATFDQIPQSPAFGPDGLLYVTTWTYAGGAGLLQIDPTTGSVLASLAVPPASGLSGIAFGQVVLATPEPVAPSVTWSPAQLTYGTPLGAAQLDATANTPGTFAYDPVAGAILGAGPQTLTAVFTPSDTTHFTSATAMTSVYVGRAAPTLYVTGGTFVYDGQPHAGSASALGVFGESLGPVSLTYNGSTNAPSVAGSYVVVANVAASTNYEPGSATGTLTITSAPLTVTANNATKTVGAPNPSFSASYAGFVAGQGPGSLGGVLTFTTSATAASPAGMYPVTPGGLASTDYALTFVPGTLTVGYSVGVLYDQTKAVKSGSTIPIKIQLVNASGANVSAASFVVTATAISYVGSAGSAAADDSGNANPDGNFRYDATLGGYIFNLSTKGLIVGVYRLSFVATGDPTVHFVQFTIGK